MNIGIFDHPPSVLSSIANLLQAYDHTIEQYTDAVVGLGEFVQAKYELILVNGVLGTAHKEKLPGSLELKDPAAIACYTINQLRHEDPSVPIIAIHQGKRLLPKGSGAYRKNGATGTIDCSLYQNPYESIDKLSEIIDAVLL